MMDKDGLVLGVVLFSRGFGFALLEPPEFLAGWGVKSIPYGDESEWASKVKKLIALYQPSTVVLPRFEYSACSPRLRRVSDEMIKAAEACNACVTQFCRKDIRKRFLPNGSRSKHSMAESLVRRFPELSGHLPAKRKQWMPEDYRMSVFEALALALVASSESEEGAL